MTSFRTAQSTATDPRQAVADISAGLAGPSPSLILFFCSNQYSLDELAAELEAAFAGIPLMGCTSAGMFDARGYGAAGLSAVAFPSGTCRVACAFSEQLQKFDERQARDLVASLQRQIETPGGKSEADSCFALQLIDGLSVREEVVTRLLQGALGKIPLVGGSAGDDMHFHQSWIYCGGKFRRAVAVVMVASRLSLYPFMTQHFEPTDARLVVTEADAPRRIVRELNGYPAAEAYAQCLGVPADSLDAGLFAANPVVVAIGADYYVRSIQRVFADGSLAFYCAIEEGVVLRVARSVDLLANLEALFSRIRSRVGRPVLVLGCECVLRRLEVERSGLTDSVKSLLGANQAIGFCTYGEQYQGVHINQTLTGIALGEMEPDNG